MVKPPVLPVFFVILWLLSLTSAAYCHDVRVLYFERPPYYYTTENGEASGFLVQTARQVFQEAGVGAAFDSVPPKRILQQLREEPVCAVGWLKTPEREEFARFSLPIYRNRPLVVVVPAERFGRFEHYSTLDEMFQDRSLVWGHVDGFLYGEFVDTLRKAFHPREMPVAATQEQLLAMLSLDRFDYMLLAPEELGTIYRMEHVESVEAASAEAGRSAGVFRVGEFVVLPVVGMPPGNKRHIMCSLGVAPEIIARLDRAILDLDLLF